MLRRLFSMGLVVTICLVSFIGIESVPILTSVPSDSVSNERVERPGNGPIEYQPIEQNGVLREGDAVPRDAHSNAEESGNGQLLPLTIEQLGFSSTDAIDARTDSMVNLQSLLSIDTAHSWKASRADINVWDLTRMYAVNGSFNDGIPGTNEYPGGNVTYYPYGWDSMSYSPDPDTIQRSQYKSVDRRYVVLENEGKALGTGSNLRFQHAGGTYIRWTQVVTNAPFTEEFILDLDYMYLRGPLGADLGNITLSVKINENRVWYANLDDLALREEWYSAGGIPLSVPGIGGSFNLSIELRVETTISADPNAIGFINAYYITACVDDVILTGTTPPSFEEVALAFYAGSQSTPIEGLLGIGEASISNTSYWTDTSLQFTISSNSSVALSYQVHLLNHRFLNSTYAADNSKVGVSYTVSPWASAQLKLYTYLGTLEGYENYTLRVHKPKDWANVSVLDPFLFDSTAECIISDDSVEVTTSALDNMGWWQVEFQSPNYLESASIQRLDSDLSQWFDADTLRTGNTTRTKAVLGTATDVPAGPYTVDMDWRLPNGSLWAGETIVGGAAGEVYSSSHILDSSGAGVWIVVVRWTNGTEVAFGTLSFTMVHRTSLTPVSSLIQTDGGLTVVGRVYYVDVETGYYILELDATVTANWSTMLSLVQNAENNWWQCQLDTSLVPLGEHQVLVTGTHPYYDPAQCTITVVSTAVTRLTSPNSPWTSAVWNTTERLTFLYEGMDHVTSIWAPVTNASGLVRASVNWTAGKWSVQETSTQGVYELQLDTSAFPAGTKLLNVTFTRPDYYSKQILLTLIVSQAASTLTVHGSSSARIDVDDTYVLKLAYGDEEGYAISGAALSVEYTPGFGLILTSPYEVVGEPGNYSLSITVLATGVFTLRLVASHNNMEPAAAVFVLVTNDLETNLAVLSGETAQVDLRDNYEAAVRYSLNNGTGVDDASLEIVFSGPSGGLAWGGVEALGSGEYSVVLSASLAGTYVVTFAASRYYYRTASDYFFLIVNEVPTTLTLLNASPAVIDMNEDYRLAMFYANSTGHPIDAASVSVASVTPSTGLAFGSTYNGSAGTYSITLSPEAAGTYSVLMRATVLNHAVALATFILIVNDISTTLTLLNGSPASTAFGQQYRLVVRYANSTNHGLDGADVDVPSVSPSIGLEVGITIAEAGGYYSIMLTPTAVGAYSILVRADLASHQSALAAFILLVSEMPTSLSLLNVSPAAVDPGQEYRLTVRYSNSTGAPLDGALVDLVSVTPAAGLTFSAVSNDTNGCYSVVMSGTVAGTYTILLRASLLNHETATVNFILLLSEISATLSILNASPSVIAFGEEYRLSMLFRNMTGYGLDGAVVEVASVSPSDGLEWEITSNESDGFYSIVLIATSSGTYSLVIKASLLNHGTALASFTLNVLPVPTALVAETSSEKVAVDRNVTVWLTYQTQDLIALPGAELVAIESPAGFELTSVVDLGNGTYLVVVIPGEVGMYTLVFRASLEDYQTAYAAISVSVVDVQTSLRTADGILSSSVMFGSGLNLYLLYERTDDYTNVSSGQFSLDIQPSGNITWRMTEENGLYRLYLSARTLGRFAVTITVEREYHMPATITYRLEVIQIDADVTAPVLESPLRVTKTYSLVLSYTMFHNASGISDAFISLSGPGSEFVTVNELGDGQYHVSVVPSGTGNSYSVTVTLGKDGFRSRSIELTFDVVLIPLSVTLLSGAFASEGATIEIAVRVTEEGTTTPVVGATVSYRLSASGTGDYILMTEDEEQGVYRAVLTLSAWDDITNYRLEVKVEKDNYEPQPVFVSGFTKTPDTLGRMVPVLTFGSVGVVAFLAAVASTRYYASRRRRLNLEATAAKKRFDDVSNLIGIIVLHRSSGITAYSKILRGGFDDTMVGAFVSAITHFREEFSMEGKHWDFEVIPISDVVSAVPTRSLICAFITAAKPSLPQETKMEAYARAAGAMFDEMLAEMQGDVIDDATAKLFDDLFVNVMDGFLLKPFKKVENGGYPRKMKCLVATAEHLDGETGFTLEQLARGMSACGVEESHAYKMIVEAIEEEILTSRDAADAKSASAFMDRET